MRNVLARFFHGSISYIQYMGPIFWSKKDSMFFVFTKLFEFFGIPCCSRQQGYKIPAVAFSFDLNPHCILQRRFWILLKRTTAILLNYESSYFCKHTKKQESNPCYCKKQWFWERALRGDPKATVRFEFSTFNAAAQVKGHGLVQRVWHEQLVPLSIKSQHYFCNLQTCFKFPL